MVLSSLTGWYLDRTTGPASPEDRFGAPGRGEPYGPRSRPGEERTTRKRPRSPAAARRRVRRSADPATPPSGEGDLHSELPHAVLRARTPRRARAAQVVLCQPYERRPAGPVTVSTGDLGPHRHLGLRLGLADPARAPRTPPASTAGSPAPPARPARGQAARCTEPSRHQDQTSSVTNGRNGANSRSSDVERLRAAPRAPSARRRAASP